jgi:protein-S-isoprenylcysteine O-methyltransferase Ste14
MRIPYEIAMAIAVVLNAVVLVTISLLLGARVEQLLLAPVFIFLVLISGWIVVESVAQQCFVERACVTVGHRGHHWLDWCSAPTLFLLCLVAIIEFGTGRSIAMGSEALGACLMAFGIGLRLIAIRGLRRHFLDQVDLLPGHRLVSTGIFAIVRHPAESGLLLIGMGTTLCLGGPLAACIVVLVLLPLACRRITREDALLLAEFGGVFAAYRGNVGGLVPRLPPMCCSSARRATRP